MAQILIQGLSKIIEKRLKTGDAKQEVILDDINGEIHAGDRLMVLGPSGSGKSTLLRMLNRLEEPTKGRILLEGVPYDEINVFSLRRTVGMVMQVPALFPLTIAENILYGPSLVGRVHQPETKVKELLDLVGLSPDFAYRRPESLSIGQQQRVSFARALANKPKILLLDEPTSALDPVASAQIEQLILQLNRELRLTIIMVTHDVEQAKCIGNRAFFLHEGRKIAEGLIPDFFCNPISTEVEIFLEGRKRG